MFVFEFEFEFEFEFDTRRGRDCACVKEAVNKNRLITQLNVNAILDNLTLLNIIFFSHSFTVLKLALRFIACLRCFIASSAFAHFFHYKNNKERLTRKIEVGHSLKCGGLTPLSHLRCR
jgi:hypothetical protein